jgi:hypothetical protein
LQYGQIHSSLFVSHSPDTLGVTLVTHPRSRVRELGTNAQEVAVDTLSDRTGRLNGDVEATLMQAI